MTTESKQADLAKMVRLEDDVHEWLTKEGRKTESYSTIIKRLIKEVNECRSHAGAKK